MSRIVGVLLFSLTSLWCGCGDDDASPDMGTDAAIDAGSDGGVDLGLADGGLDGSVADACADGCLPGLDFPEEWSVSGALQTFSSPQAVDVDGDGTFEIALGHGVEDTTTDPEPTGTGFVTLHDAEGNELWRTDTDDEMVGTVLAVDLDGDDLPDVVAGGRNAILVALKGTDGSLLWEFTSESADPRDDGWFNFYSPVELPDLNDDGIAEVLAANGGDARLAPGTERPPSHLMIFDGSNGDLLASPQLPDDRETYCSPLLYRERPADPLRVLVGTGGETAPGSLWSFTVDQVFAGDLGSGIELLGPSSAKGFIAPPSFADLDEDGVQDVVVPTFEGQLVAIDGATHDELWSVEATGHETYTSPVIAELDASNPGLEVYCAFSRGVFPEYDQSRHFIVAARTGAVLYDEVFAGPFVPSPVAGDIDDDDQDELLVATFDWRTGMRNVYRFDELTITATETEAGGGMPTPWLGDLDGDGEWELIEGLTGFDEDMMTYWTLRRRSVGAVADAEATWPTYLPFGRHP